MDIHEFQAKKILQSYGIPIPPFAVISSLAEADAILDQYQWSSAVLKVQIHAGGRGKAGGVQFAKDRNEIRKWVKELLGKKIVTPQTGKEGLVASQLLLSSPLAIAHEYYLSIAVNRERAQNMLLISSVGGVEIEQVAQEHPDQVLFLPIPLDGVFRSYHLYRIANFMRWKGKIAKQGIECIKKLVQAFVEIDATLVEINPLVETKEGDLYALDAKISLDDNALFRHPDLKALFDPSQVNPYEALAREIDLAYVSLDGNIGCMVNGAGLAMATMDLIKHYGGEPANFLDVGGSASKEIVAEGFKIILSDPKVKVILINIFGGIMNCGTIAEGIIAAAEELHIHVPLVVRLEGTNVDQGKHLLQETKLQIISAHDLTSAAQKAVALAR